MRRRHVTPASIQVEEDYGSQVDERKDPAYWKANLPTDDLENQMWGGQGVPAPVSSPTSKFQKSWTKRDQPDGAGEAPEAIDEDNASQTSDANAKHNDNISMAMEATPTDEIILEDLVWKQRSGFGKYYMGILNHEWEQRRVALFASGKLRYYALTSPSSPKTAAKSGQQNLWEFSSEPRGELLLNSKIKVKARRRSDNPGPTPFEIDIIQRDTNHTWRFCFISQSIQSEWMSYFYQKTKPADGEEYSDDSDDDDIGDSSDSLDSHGLRPGDHIIRWEMLPIIYPIQIHGIVLEAGKNCLIIADFGLTSHASHGGSEELSTFEEDNPSQDLIMQAWEKVKPKEKKRLNIIAITDPKEIRKWSKISYGDRVAENEKEKKGFLTSLLGGKSSPKTKKKKGATDKQATDVVPLDGMENLTVEAINGDKQSISDTTMKEGVSKIQEHDESAMQIDVAKIERVDGEPEWFHSQYRPRIRTTSSDAPIIIEDGQSVFNVDHPVEKISSLPKSDSAKLVLARTHFLLENEDLVPPYHVSMCLIRDKQ